MTTDAPRRTPPPQPVHEPPPTPPPPPKIETPEEALAQANHDRGGDVHGQTHEQTQANLADSRQTAIDRAMQEGRTGDITAINGAYDQAQARLDAADVAYQHKPERPTEQTTSQTPAGETVQQATYADGTRIVQTDGKDANGSAVVTTQVFQPGVTGPAAVVPLESRTVVTNGVSTTTGLPQRTVEQAPNGQGTVITDAYGGDATNPDRLVQHLVVPNGEGGYQVQSTTLRSDGADAGVPPALRIREVSADGTVAFDTGEVSKVVTADVPGQPGVKTVTHQYDGGARMEYSIHAAPAGSEGVPDALLSQKLTSADGTILFQRDGVTRAETVGQDGRRQVVDTAGDGSRTVYSLGSDGKLATTQLYDKAGALQQTVERESVSGLPVVTSRETLTRADGTKVITEYNEQGQPVGIQRIDADGQTIEEMGSLKGERVDPARVSDIASDILDVGDRTMWRDNYEERLLNALQTMQGMDPVSQQMVLAELQKQDPGMGQSWFKTGILENLQPDQMRLLEGGGLDIMTGIPGTTAADLQAIKTIDQHDADGDAYTGEYGELAATGDEQKAGQLQAFMTEYNARAGDPASQARFVELYRRMHGDAFVEGFLSDENLARARDGGVSLYNSGDKVTIDRGTYDLLMGDRLETEADRRPEVLAARDRVMDAGVRRFMVDNQEQRVQALVTEMAALDPEGQAALMRQIVKEDPDARLNWLRDSIIQRATDGNQAFTPEMRQLMTDIRGNGGTSFMGQLQGFGGGLKDAGVGFVVGLGALVRTSYDLQFGWATDQLTGGNGPAFLPSAKRGNETATAMVEGLPHMFDHIGSAWNDGRYGEALGNVTFDVASLVIPLKIPKIRLPGGAGAVDNVAGAIDNVAPVRYIDESGRAIRPPAVEPRLATVGPDGVYRITDAAPPRTAPRLAIEAPPPRLAIEAAPTPELIAQRQATAIRFYEQATGRPVDLSHLGGIDFARPVEVRTLPKGTVVYQWQVPGGPKGNYFSFSDSARPTDIGIADIGAAPSAYSRVRAIQEQARSTPQLGVDPRYAAEVAPSGILPKAPTRYVVTEDTQVLVSTANRIDDTWAIPDNTLSMPTQGGRLQIYTGNSDLFQPMVRGVDPPNGLPPGVAPGAYAVPPGRSFADDVLGGTPHRLDGDFMQIAQHVYKADGSPLGGSFRQVAQGDLPPGFSAADFNHSSGLRAGLYTNGQGQYVLAFKGTVPFGRTTLKDIYADGAQGLGFPTGQYAHAVDLTRRLYEVYGDNLVLTGHSLGGGLASQAAMAVGAGNLPAVVFNPAAVHGRNLARNNPLFRNDGGVQQAPDGGAFANGRELAPYFAEQGGLIRAYMVRNDELTWFQDHLPGVPDALGHRESLPGKFPVGHTMSAVEESFNKRFPDGRPAEVPADIGLWYIDPATGQWTTRLPEQ